MCFPPFEGLKLSCRVEARRVHRRSTPKGERSPIGYLAEPTTRCRRYVLGNGRRRRECDVKACARRHVGRDLQQQNAVGKVFCV